MVARSNAISIGDGRWIDWYSQETHALMNPRLPAAEAARLKEGLKAVPALPGHLWIATSGTTGTLKWVALPKEAMLSAAAAANRHFESTRTDIWFRSLPLFHVGGLSILARSHLSGAKVVGADSRFSKWSAPLFAQLLEESGATLTSLVPTQLHDLVVIDMECPPALRAVAIGGAALTPALYARARELGWPVLPTYGMTECCSMVATAPLTSLDSREFPALEILSHFEARISDSGENWIELKGSSLLTGMAIESAKKDGRFAFADPKLKDGWFRTGDTGQLHGRRLRVGGRGESYVKIAGEGVDLNRIQSLFDEARLEVDPLFDAAVVALPDERLGHALVLVCAPGATQEKIGLLEAAFNKRVLPVEKIRAIRTAAIPRTPLGKLVVWELVAQLASSE